MQHFDFDGSLSDLAVPILYGNGSAYTMVHREICVFHFISTPQGGLKDLFPLLEVNDETPLTPKSQLRNDVITLMQVGLFVSVEVMFGDLHVSGLCGCGYRIFWRPS